MRLAGWGALCGVLACLTGCATVPESLGSPRIRVGGLPYPGVTNYLALEPPHALGAHRYQRVRGLDDLPDEVPGGIVYTRHGGFIDLAHVRSTLDWVRYVYLVSLDALMAPAHTDPQPLRWSWLGMDYQLQVLAPQAWKQLDQERRLPMARDAARVLAMRLAVVISTWHEIGSWYGQMIVPPINEIRSAFTWDDTSSHVFAVRVAERALAAGDPHRPDGWNRAVTRELAAALALLGPVDLACQNEALARTQGVWWFAGQTLRRDLDTGLQGSLPKQPWLVQGLGCVDDHSGGSAGARPGLDFRLPGWRSLEQATGWPMQSWFEWEVSMPDWLSDRVQGCHASCMPRTFRGESAVLAAIDRIRTQLESQQGAQVLRPDGITKTSFSEGSRSLKHVP
jgi:hypothetical protein